MQTRKEVPDPNVIKKIMLNSAEHEILNDRKYKISRNSASFMLR